MSHDIHFFKLSNELFCQVNHEKHIYSHVCVMKQCCQSVTHTKRKVNSSNILIHTFYLCVCLSGSGKIKKKSNHLFLSNSDFPWLNITTLHNNKNCWNKSQHASIEPYMVNFIWLSDLLIMIYFNKMSHNFYFRIYLNQLTFLLLVLRSCFNHYLYLNK